MKHTFKHVGTAALALTLLLSGCSQTAGQTSAQGAGEDTGSSGTQALSLVTDIPTTQYFTDEAVKEEDVTTILTAGVNAPSAMNSQPWHFTAITDQATLQQIADDMGGGFPAGMQPSTEGETGADAPAALPEDWDGELPEGMQPPEGPGDGEDMPSAPADNGEESGAAPAKADITGAPLAIVISCGEDSELDAGLACQTMSVTAQLLGIPEDYSAAAILLVGYADSSAGEADGATGATERNPLDEQVTYVAAE